MTKKFKPNVYLSMPNSAEINIGSEESYIIGGNADYAEFWNSFESGETMRFEVSDILAIQASDGETSTDTISADTVAAMAGTWDSDTFDLSALGNGQAIINNFSFSRADGIGQDYYNPDAVQLSDLNSSELEKLKFSGNDVVYDGRVTLKSGIAIDGDYYLYATDGTDKKFYKVTENGLITAMSGTWNNDTFDLSALGNGQAIVNKFGFSNANDTNSYADVLQLSSLNSSELAKFKRSGNDVVYDERVTLKSGIAIDGDYYLYATDGTDKKFYKVTSNGLITAMTGTSNSDTFDLTALGSDSAIINNFQFSSAYGYQDSDVVKLSGLNSSELAKFKLSGNEAVYDGRVTLKSGYSRSGDYYLYATDGTDKKFYKVTSNGLITAMTGTSNSDTFDLTALGSDSAIINNFQFSSAYGYQDSDVVKLSGLNSSELAKFKLSGNEAVYDGRVTLKSGYSRSGDYYLYATDGTDKKLYKITDSGLLTEKKGEWNSEIFDLSSLGNGPAIIKDFSFSKADGQGQNYYQSDILQLGNLNSSELSKFKLSSGDVVYDGRVTIKSSSAISGDYYLYATDGTDKKFYQVTSTGLTFIDTTPAATVKGSVGADYFNLKSAGTGKTLVSGFGFSDAYGFARKGEEGADVILLDNTGSTELQKVKLTDNGVVYDNRVTLKSSSDLNGDCFLYAGTSSDFAEFYKVTSTGLVKTDTATQSKSSTAQEAIKKLMASLTTTTLYRTDALDEAVRASSTFTSWQDVIDSMIADCASYDDGGNNYVNGNGRRFLEEKCSIYLYNEDTGAITGSDAGSGVVKTAESIVPEDTSTFIYPSSSTSTFDGLTVKWPDKSTLTEAQKIIVAGLNTWWIPNSLKLIEESYGLSFSDSNATIKTLTVNFVDGDSSSLASAGQTYDSEGKRCLTLNINNYSWKSMSSTNPNGLSESYTYYLDRTIAHELTHSIMMATISDFGFYPTAFIEGTAELTHGIDDKRNYSILVLASNSSELRDPIEKNSRGNEYAYAGGYMLLRYFAYQSSEATDDTTTASDNTRTITTNNGVLTSTGTKAVVLTAKGSGDTLDGGVNNTNDTLVSAGSGKNTTFFLHKNGGKDIVQNFVFGGDKTTDDVVALDGSFDNDGLITAGNGSVKIGFDNLGSLMLTGTAGQNEFAYNYGGNLGIVSADMSNGGMRMAFDADANLYVGQGTKTNLVFKSQDVIAGTGSNGSFAGFGWNSPYISAGLGVIDARDGHVAAINGSNDVNQIIYASTVVGGESSKAGGSVFLCGGLGENFSNHTADTLVGSAKGNTTYYVGCKMGNDILEQAVGGDMVVFIDTKVADLASFTGTSKNFTASFTGGATVKLNAATDITSANSIKVQFDDVTYKWNGASLTQA